MQKIMIKLTCLTLFTILWAVITQHIRELEHHNAECVEMFIKVDQHNYCSSRTMLRVVSRKSQCRSWRVYCCHWPRPWAPAWHTRPPQWCRSFGQTPPPLLGPSVSPGSVGACTQISRCSLMPSRPWRSHHIHTQTSQCSLMPSRPWRSHHTHTQTSQCSLMPSRPWRSHHTHTQTSQCSLMPSQLWREVTSGSKNKCETRLTPNILKQDPDIQTVKKNNDFDGTVQNMHHDEKTNRK